MAAEKIHLTREKETLLITLYCRVLESRSADPILKDEPGEAILEKIDYDFGKLGVALDDQLTTAVRARQFDVWTGEFLTQTPNATVLHLGCGLDSRVYRTDPPAGVRWYDVDFPDVIELRRRLYPQREGYWLIGSSVTESTWLADVPADRPTLIMAEGLMMYLTEAEVKTLLGRLTAHFTSGQLVFDAFNSLGIRMAKRHKGLKVTGVSVGWGIDEPRDIETWNSCLTLTDEWPFMLSPAVNKLPWPRRLLLLTARRFLRVRRAHRLLRFQF